MKKQNDTKYRQLEEALKSELRSGSFRPGDRFFTVREIIERFGVSAVTVTRTMTEMTRQGFFESRGKLGTFVRESDRVPGMTGDVMTSTLYVSGIPTEMFQQSNLHWFIFDEIRRGIINAYPGPVRIETKRELRERRERGEVFLNICIIAGTPEGSEREQADVIIDTARMRCRDWNYISYELMSGIFDAVRHLVLSCRLRRIAFWGEEDSRFHSERVAAYRMALEVLGIPFDPELLILEADYTRMAERVLALSRLPEAIVCANDVRAMRLIEALKKAGLSVPEDLSVTGLDDMPGADEFTPPLTTVRIPYAEVGEEAVNMLFRMLRSGQKQLPKIFHGELMVRKSTRSADSSIY